MQTNKLSHLTDIIDWLNYGVIAKVLVDKSQVGCTVHSIANAQSQYKRNGAPYAVWKAQTLSS